MEGHHPLVWQTSRVPKAHCSLLRCGVQIDARAGVAWLLQKACDGLEEMVGYMYTGRWMRWPREHFPLAVAPQVGGKDLVRLREIGEDQLTGAQKCCQGRRYSRSPAK